MNVKTGILLVPIVLTSPATARSNNDTGMMRCANTSNQFTTDCMGTSQDGELGRDANFPDNTDGHAGFSFTKVCHSGEVAGSGRCPSDPVPGGSPRNWGCTLDRTTGLIWELKTVGGPRDLDRNFDWLGAQEFINSLNQTGLCGAEDWRIPSRYELQSIVWYGNGVLFANREAIPAIDNTWFPNTAAGLQWTSTMAAHGRTAISAGMGELVTDMDGEVAHVRAVRHVKRKFPARFKRSDDEINDTAAGLIWRRCSEGQTWTGTQCFGFATSFDSWFAAITHGRDEAVRTGKPWRLPNVKELNSIVRPGFVVTFDKVFPQTEPEPYWTSTPVAQRDSAIATEAWTVLFDTGGIARFLLEGAITSSRVRLVRDAPSR